MDLFTDIEWEGYFTEANLRWFVIGAGSAALAVGLLALLRRSPGWIVGVVAPVLALFTAAWLEWPEPSVEWIAAAVVGALSGHGFEQLRGGSPTGPLLLLACAGGVWLAVPENDPVLVVAGAIAGLWLLGRLSDPGVGWGVGFAVAWSVVLGARTWGWSFTGGLLCLAPLVAVSLRTWMPGFRSVRGLLPAWPWLVIGGGAVTFAAARWVGVAPDASWTRVGVVAAWAVGLAAVTRH